MSDPVYQGSYNDLFSNYITTLVGNDEAKNIMQWKNFADGWKINDNLGLIASPDMDVISNPSIGVSLDKYNEIYQDRKSLDPYKNKDTGWIWNSDKGAYYWPSLPITDIEGNKITEYSRHLYPGEENKSHGMFGSFSPALSFFTGGLSDLIQGDKLGEGFLGEKGGSLFQDFVLSTGTAGLSDAYKGYEKYQDTGDIFAGGDRMVDPGGVVDFTTRKIGSLLPDAIRQNAPALGSAIGSLIYPVAGTAAGYGVGAKIKGGEDVYNYKGDMIGAGTAAALAYLAKTGMGKVGSYFSTPTSRQAATQVVDPEVQSILQDMSEATYPDYSGENYLESVYEASQAHPGAMYTIEGPSVSQYAEPDVNSLYENIRPAPANPGLDYPIADPKTGLPVYGNTLYDYTVNPETGEIEFSDTIKNSKPAYDTRTVDKLYNDPYRVLEDEKAGSWDDYLKDLLKMLKGLKIGEDTEGTPGYIKSWFGGSGLDMSEESYNPNRSKGRRDLGMEMLEGTDLDLDKILSPYLEDYVYSGR